jgi:hypothetical protein
MNATGTDEKTIGYTHFIPTGIRTNPAFSISKKLSIDLLKK